MGGSDGKTYKNLCLFAIEKCQARKTKKIITMKQVGSCGQPPPADCSRRCPKTKQHVCGSDRKTYTNVCLLLVEKCKANKVKKDIIVKKRGFCKKDGCTRKCPKNK